MTSERRLAEIRGRLAAATPGPWELYATERNVIAITKGRLRNGYRREIVHCSGFDCSNIDDPRQVRANAALIAHAPSDLAYLLDEIARLSRELEAAREGCPVCGHEWRRHDPADGRCDAASEDPLRDGAVCPCGRDLAWMQARIAELSRRALVADTEASDGE